MFGRVALSASGAVGSLPWDVSSLTYVQNVSVDTTDSPQPVAVFFKDDGTSMYVILDNFVDAVAQYDLSTSWDISTASYSQQYSVGSRESAPLSLFFSPDGIYMYVVGSSGDDVNQFTLGTAWDISTASYTRVYSVAARSDSPNGIYFSSDGYNMYVSGTNTNRYVNQYSLSTAWNISTASYVARIYNEASGATTPSGLWFKPDGTAMYLYYYGNGIGQWSLSTPWDITTASYQKVKDIPSDATVTCSFYIRDNGEDLYTVSTISGRFVEQYSMG